MEITHGISNAFDFPSKSERPSPGERAEIPVEKLAAIDECFKTHGIVVLNDVIPHCALDSLRPRLEEDVLRQLLSYKEVGSSRLCCTWTADMKTPGHYGTLCPKHHPHLRPEIHANPTVESVVEHLLGGPGFFMISAGGNCALPGSGYQALHSDGSHIWKSEAEAKATGESWPHRCRFVVANFGIDDITEEMGATEVWPGSHADMAVVMNNASASPRKGTEDIETFFPEAVFARRKVVAPVRMTCRKGCVVLRDNRCWHKGVPNTTTNPRHMVGLAYIASDRWSGRGTGEMVFGPATRQLLTGSRCQFEPYVEFADGPNADGKRLIEGHGDWQMALPNDMTPIVSTFKDAPWANYKDWAVCLAERVFARKEFPRL